MLCHITYGCGGKVPMVTAIQKIFDRALELECGQVITLTFKDANDMRSNKTLLFREKARYEQKLKGKAKEVIIRQEMKANKGIYKLHISSAGSSDNWQNDVLIMDKDGSLKLYDF